MKITEKHFGTTSDGQEVKSYILENENGSLVEILSYGGIIRRFVVDGVDIVTGYDTIEGYENGEAYMGAIIGRVANRIGHGTFSIDGEEFHIPINNMGNTNHGGLEGFDSKLWNVVTSDKGLFLNLESPDGDEGFPGKLETEVSYYLDDQDRLIINLSARTDQKTPVNLTLHPYFNLNGEGNIKDHRLTVFSDLVTESDETLLPTGAILNVQDTALDFTNARPIKEALERTEEKPIQDAKGLDHNYIFKASHNNKILPMAKLEGDRLSLTILSDQPGLQVYTGNYLDDTGKRVYQPYDAVAFEPQNWPDSINHTHFPEMLLEPDNVYSKVIIYDVKSNEETE